MKNILACIFFAYLVLSINGLNINLLKRKSKMKTPKNKKVNFSKRISTSKSSLSKHSRTKIFIAALLISTIWLMGSIGSSLLASTVAALTSSTALAVLSVTFIGGSLTFGALSVKAIIDARQSVLAKNTMQLFNNQLKEKGRLCFSVKNINSIMDDMLEISLFKNHVELLKAKDNLSKKPEQFNYFAQESASFEESLNALWNSNKKFETLVCTKSIDIVGETRYLKNRISKMNPSIFNTSTVSSRLYDSFKIFFKQISPFFKMLDAINGTTETLEKIITQKYLNPKTFSNNIFERNNKLQAQIQNDLSYDSKLRLQSELIDYKYDNFEILEYPANLYDPETKEECKSSNPWCIMKLLISIIPSFKSYYNKNASDENNLTGNYYNQKIQGLIDDLKIFKDVEKLSQEIKKYSVQMLFDMIYVTSVQTNIILGIKDVFYYISKAYTYGDVAVDFQPNEHKTPPNMENILKSNLIQPFVRSFFNNKEKELFATKISKAISSTIKNIKNSLYEVEELKKNINNSDEEAIQSAIYRLKQDFISKILGGMRYAFSIGCIGFTSVFYMAFHYMAIFLTNLKENINSQVAKEFFNVLSFISSSLIKFIPIIFMVSSIALNLQNLYSQYNKLKMVKREISMENMIIKNFNFLILSQIDYLIPKYLMKSILNLEKLNDFVTKESITQNFIFSSRYYDWIFKSNIYTKPYSRTISSYRTGMIEYIKKRCKIHANFCIKYFTIQFFNESKLFSYKSDVKEFKKELTKIYYPIIQYGPISTLVSVDDNLLNTYGFTRWNAGYKMFKSDGKAFSSNIAIIYCRGCYNGNNMYLSYIDFTADFPENEMFNNLKKWYDVRMPGKDDYCNDLNFVDNSKSEMDNDENFTYSYFNACYRQVDPEAEGEIELVRSIYQESIRNKMKIGNQFKYPSGFLNPNILTSFDSYKSDISHDCYDTSNKLSEINDNTAANDIVDLYYYEREGNLQNQCLIMIKTTPTILEAIEIIYSIRDNFILEKLKKLEEYKKLELKQEDYSSDKGKPEENNQPYTTKQVKSNNSDSEKLHKKRDHPLKLPPMYHTTIIKDTVIESKLYSDGRNVMTPELDIIFKMPELETDKKTEISCLESIHKFDEDILTIVKVGRLSKDKNCFSTIVNDFKEQICMKREIENLKKNTDSNGKEITAELDQKIVKKIKCESKLLYEIENETLNIYKIKIVIHYYIKVTSLKSCQKDLPFSELLAIYNPDLGISDLNSNADYFMMKRGNEDSSEDYRAIIPKIDEFIASLSKYSIKKYGNLEENISVAFLDYNTIDGRSKIPKDKIYQTVLGEIPKEYSNLFECIRLTDFNMLFPLLKNPNEKFYIKKIETAEIDYNEAEKLNVILQTLELKEKEEMNSESEQFDAFSIDDMPISQEYFVEFLSRAGGCASTDKTGAEKSEISSGCSMKFILAKGYIPYYPNIDTEGLPIIPPENMMFMFPHPVGVCFGFRIWVKMDYSNFNSEKEKFCVFKDQNEEGLNPKKYKKSKSSKNY